MSFSGRQVVRYNMLSGKTTTGHSDPIKVTDFRNAVIVVSSSGNANFTLKVKGAIATHLSDVNAPTFSSAASPTNQWAYVQSVNLDDGTPVTGSTGISTAGTDICKAYEINVNALDFIDLELSAISAGAVTVDAILTSNL